MSCETMCHANLYDYLIHFGDVVLHIKEQFYADSTIAIVLSYQANQIT